MSTSHRKPRARLLPSVRRGAAICAALPPLALALGGVAVADSGATGGQTSPCAKDVVCAPVNVGVNAPDVLHDGVGILDAVHLRR